MVGGSEVQVDQARLIFEFLIGDLVALKGFFDFLPVDLDLPLFPSVERTDGGQHLGPSGLPLMLIIEEFQDVLPIRGEEDEALKPPR